MSEYITVVQGGEITRTWVAIRRYSSQQSLDMCLYIRRGCQENPKPRNQCPFLKTKNGCSILILFVEKAGSFKGSCTLKIFFWFLIVMYLRKMGLCTEKSKLLILSADVLGEIDFFSPVGSSVQWRCSKNGKDRNDVYHQLPVGI